PGRADLARVPRVDVVVDAVAEPRDLAAEPVARDAQEDVQPEADLLLQIRVADLVRVGGQVWPLGEELARVRRAERARGARAEPEAAAEVIERADRRRCGAEVPRPDLSDRRHAGSFGLDPAPVVA